MIVLKFIHSGYSYSAYSSPLLLRGAKFIHSFKLFI